MGYMDFSIKYREVQDGVIFDLIGPLMLGNPASSVREQVETAIASGKKKLAFNLGKVTFTDSSGLGSLIGAITSLERIGGHCTFFGAPDQFLKVVKQVGLAGVFDISPDEKSVLEAWAKP